MTKTSLPVMLKKYLFISVEEMLTCALLAQQGLSCQFFAVTQGVQELARQNIKLMLTGSSAPIQPPQHVG